MKVALRYFVSLLIPMLVSCDSTEIRYQYYDSNNNDIKSKAEYKDGKLNGFMAAYSVDGRLAEVSEWEDDQRHGRVVSFYATGDTAAVYTFRHGRALGEYKIFYESGGGLYKVGFAGEDGFTINTKIYKPDGSMFPMEPIVGVKSDTINLGDTLVIRGTLANIQDNRFSSGFMMVGKTLSDGYKKDFIDDTLAITSSYFNDYKLKLVPHGKGDFEFVVQFKYRFNKGLSLDTMFTFSNKRIVYVR